MKTSEAPIIVEQLFNVSKETVWKAITEPAQMKLWFFEQMKDFKPVVGFETEFMVKSETRDFPHHWKVIEVITNEKMTVNWKFPSYAGNSVVTFQVTEDQKMTKLTLIAEATEDYPEEIPEFKRESAVGGWNYFIKQRLKEYLD